jgi:hypothetical protein
MPQPALAPHMGPGLGLAPAGGAPPPPGHGGGMMMPAPAAAPGAPGGGFMPRPLQPPGAVPMVPGGVAAGALPAGFFDPRQVSDITILSHDWSVEPGHSYHYKMRYAIYNPLFGVQQGNVKAADRDRLSVKSPYSAWTGPIDIPTRYRFWVQKFQRNGNNEVTFDLFRKNPGVPGGVERNIIRVTPGDTIGASPWLLVDVRQDSARRFYYFLVADPLGHIERHELEKDKQDQEHLDMLERSGATAGVGPLN